MSLFFNHWKGDDNLEDEYNQIIGGIQKGRDFIELRNDIEKSLSDINISRLERQRLIDLQNKLENE